jgi:hypothetical protein
MIEALCKIAKQVGVNKLNMGYLPLSVSRNQSRQGV